MIARRSALQAEFFRLQRRRMTYTLAAIMVAAIAFIYLFFWSVSAYLARTDPSSAQNVDQLRALLRFSEVVPIGFGQAQNIGLILAVIMAGATAGGEYAWGTVRTVDAFTGDRAAVLGSRLVMLVVCIVAGLAVGIVTAILCSFVYSLATGDGSLHTFSVAFIVSALAGLARTTYAVLPYPLMAFAVGVVSRSSAVAIGSAIGTWAGDSTLVLVLGVGGSAFGRIADVTVSRSAETVLAANGRVGLGVANNSLPPENLWLAVGVLGAYDLLFLIVSVLVYQRRDITD